MKTTEGLLADFLTQAEAAVALRICKRTLERWRRLGEGRPISKIGRRVLYRPIKHPEMARRARTDLPPFAPNACLTTPKQQEKCND